MKVTYVGNAAKKERGIDVTYTGGSAQKTGRVKATYVGGTQSKAVYDAEAKTREARQNAAETQKSTGREVGNISALGAGNYGADKHIFGEGYNVGQGLAKAGQIGLTQIAKAGSSAGAWLENQLGNFAREGTNGYWDPDTSKWLFNRWNQAIDAEAQGVQQRYAENTQRGGRAAEVFEDMSAATVATLPQAVAAVLTGGASAAAQAGALAERAAATPGLVGTISRGMRAMAKDPNFQLSFVQVFGPGYEQAKADGADDLRASLYAVGNGLMNAAVEVGGGIQTLPKELQTGGSAWKSWVDSMLEEGKEEVVQGVIERAMQNTVYGRDNPYIGVGNGAIFDPAAAAEEFAGGAVVGGLLGGGQIGLNTLANRAAYNAAKAQYNRDVRQNTAPEMDSKAAQAVDAVTRGKSITGNQAAAIAKNPVAVETLEANTGVKLNTQQPISQLKRDIAALASRDTTQTQAQGTTATPVTQRRAQKPTGGFLEAGQKAYQEMSRTAEDVPTLYAGFSSVYNAGLNGIEASKAKGAYAAMLTPEQRYAAYNAGLEDAAAQVARENAEVKSVTTTAGAGLADNVYSRAVIAKSKRTAATLNAMGKKLGVRIEFVDSVMGGQANGQYIRDKNLIQIAVDSNKPYLNVAAHEVTHRMQDLSPAEYRKFRQAAMEHHMREKGIDEMAEVVEWYREKADSAGVTLTQDEVMDEIAADFAGDMMENPDLFREFSQSNRTAAQKLLDSLKEFIAKVKSIFTGKARDVAAQEAYGKDFAELEAVAQKWQEAFDAAEQQAERATVSATVRSGDTVQYDDAVYSLRVTDKDTLDFLNKQKTITTYKTMQLVDGKLYPPMAARVDGKYEDASELGAWEMSVERPDLVKDGKFKLDKGKGQGSLTAAYNPYMHSSNLVINDQFSGAYTRDNLVTVECEVPVSEMTSGYHADGAKDSVGWHSWHTGTVAGQVRRATGVERKVFLSRWIKPVRILPDAEVANMYKELLGDTGIEVPDNVVTPGLLAELKKAGVPIKESGRVKTAAGEGDGRMMLKDYSYDALVRKPDMTLAVVEDADGLTRKEVVDKALAEAKKCGGVNQNGNVYVHVNDTDADVIISAKALRHGLDRRFTVNAPATLKVGEILQNAVRVNELVPKLDTVDATYVLMGAAKNKNNEPYIVQFVVNRASNEVMSVDVLYAINAKTEPAGSLSPEITGVPATLTGSSISIADLLTYVNRYFPDVLPESVLRHFGHSERPAGKLGEGALFSLKATDSTGRQLSEQQQAFFKDSKVRDAEGRLKTVYHGSSAQFTKFSADFMSKNGSSEGQGFYFTDLKTMAQGYEKDGGQLLEGYLDIKNPLSDSEVTLSNAEVKRLIMAIDPTGDDLVLNYDSRGGMGYPSRTWYNRAVNDTLRMTMETSESDSEILAELANGMGNPGAVLKAAREVLGYDGYIVEGKYDDATVYVAFDSSQFKNVDNLNPTSNPDIRYQLRETQRLPDELEDLRDTYIRRYGEIPEGENATRQVRLPRKTSDKEKVSQTVRTILEANATPDEIVPTIEELALRGEYSYEAYSDKQAISDAETKIKDVGWAQALTSWTDKVRGGNVSKENTAMGWALYNNAANSGDTATALTILNNMVEHQRSAAQTLQATRILKKLSPETQLYQVQRSVKNLQEEINKRYGDKKSPKLKIDRELAERFLRAKDQTERDNVLTDIYRDIGRQMPSRFIDKWNAWRYLAMLGNARTHIRNIVGNAGFAPVVAVKNAIATGIEAGVNKVSGGKLNRSKAFISGKGGKALFSAAAADFDKIQDVAMGGGKYSEFANANKAIEEGRVIFQSKMPGLKQVSQGLEKARRFNSAALETEDMWFSKPHYAYAMAQYCKANGITADMIAEGKGIEKARKYAIKEAQKATYRDTNAFSQFVSEIGRRRGSKTGVEKIATGIIEGILPFRKTPANILMRGVEYSPLGLANGIKQALWDVRTGKKTGAEAIDSISAGLTGTGLLGLGVYLASQALLRGHGGDDDDKREFEDLQGHQTYSLELPDGTSITLDWLAPECLPLFIGVNLWEETNGGRESLTLSELLTAISNVSEPLLEMSCLQSLNAIFDVVGYAKSDGIAALPKAIASAATSYLTQALPTLLGQAERTGEGNRYTTYTNKNNKYLTPDMQYAVGKASARIPGWDYNQIPYIDAWGRTELTGKPGERAFNNFLNPAYTSKIDESPMEKELMRLYNATGEAVFPSRASKNLTVSGEAVTLGADDYVKYAQQKGQGAYKRLTALTRDSEYKKLTNEEKVRCVKDLYTLTDQIAKSNVSKYEPESWVTKALAGEKKGISATDYVIARAKTSDVESLKDKNGETIANSKGLLVMEQIYSIGGLTSDQRQYLFSAMGVGKKIIHYNKALVQQELRKIRNQ